ncbi:putative ribonuclease H-like domain-containing protein [Tanacetum coccineum]
MDVQSAFLYGKIEEEVYVCQPPGFEDPDFPDRVYKVEKALYGLHQAPIAWYETLLTYLLDNEFQRGKLDKTLFIKRYKGDILLVQVYVDDIIFGSTKKKLCIAFEKFTKVKTASTPMETQKPLLKDKDGEEVDVHMYRSMIGLLMYLTSSRLDIMFAVCVCARYQVNPKVLHLHDVKRIFRTRIRRSAFFFLMDTTYGLTELYPKDSPFDLVAYTDSDYAGASLDRKSTTGGCQFLGCRLISWQCKKQTVVANSTTEAEKSKESVKLMMEKLFGMELELMLLMLLGITYYCWVKVNDVEGIFINTSIKELMMEKLFRMKLELMLLHALVDGKKIIITESIVRRDLQLEDAEGVDCLPNSTIFEQLTLMGSKTTTWNEFSSTMASAIICLATNQKFNFSKFIFEGMIRNLDNVSEKFLMYPSKGSANPTDLHHTPTITQSSTQPQKTQKPRKPKRKDTQVPQSSNPSENVADEVHKELGDSLLRAATTTSSLEAEQDSGNITKTRSKATPNESSSLGTTSGGGPMCQETMGDTIAQTRFENVSKHSNDSLLTRARVESSRDEEDLGEDASKQGRRINAIDADEDITLVNVQDDADNEMFDVNVLNGEKVFIVGQNENVVEEVV